MSFANTDKTDPLDRESALLPKDVPARVARWTAWFLLLLATVVAIFGLVFKLPETVLAPFELVATEAADPVQTAIAGDLVGVFVREGQTIRAGEELFRVRSDEIRNAHSRRRQLKEDMRALGERSLRLAEAHVTELAVNDSEILHTERELASQRKHLALSHENLRRGQTLLARGMVAEVYVLPYEVAAAESEKDEILTEKQLQKAKLQRREVIAARQRQLDSEQADLEKSRLQLEALDEQLRDSVGDFKSIRATFDATVTRVEYSTPGAVVPAGAVLCQLARVSSKPVARLYLSEVDTGKVAIGQGVRLFLSAFPYQRHGTISATIRWMSPTPVTADNRSGFVALLDLSEVDVSRLPLRIGMQGEARILVGQRTLLNRALEPLRAAREQVIWVEQTSLPQAQERLK